MTKQELRELVSDWCNQSVEPRNEIFETKKLVDFLEHNLYHDYEPTKSGQHGDFGLRLAKWIGSTNSEEDQRNLYLMLRHLFYVGKADIDSAYTTAFSNHVMNWLITLHKIDVFSDSASDELSSEIGHTAFTAITDSFRLGDFLRVNNIHGDTTRYIWEQHKNNWTPQNFIDEVISPLSSNKYNIVLFEDIVGSGSQANWSINTICSMNSPRINILFCPIIICPGGAEIARNIANQYSNFHYSPILEIPEEHFIKRDPVDGEHPDFLDIRKTLTNVHPLVAGSPGSWQQDHGPFGFGGNGGMGGFIVKYDNCPDNTVPAIHRQSDLGWSPLFYRTSREQI